MKKAIFNPNSLVQLIMTAGLMYILFTWTATDMLNFLNHQPLRATDNVMDPMGIRWVHVILAGVVFNQVVLLVREYRWNK